MAGISGANSCKGVSIFSFPSIFQANCDTDFVGAKSVSDKKETSWKSEHSQRPKVNLPILELFCRCCVWWMESFSDVHNQFKCEDSSPLDQPSPCAEKAKSIFQSTQKLILTSWLKLEHPWEDSSGKFIMIEGWDLSQDCKITRFIEGQVLNRFHLKSYSMVNNTWKTNSQSSAIWMLCNLGHKNVVWANMTSQY